MTKESVFAPFMDPCDIYLPQDVTGELWQSRFRGM